MTTSQLLMLSGSWAVLLLVLSAIASIAIRTRWFYFLAILLIILSGLAIAGKVSQNPGGTYISFFHHIIPWCSLCWLASMLRLKRRVKEYPIVATTLSVIIGVIISLSMFIILSEMHSPYSRSALFGLL